MRNLKFGFTLAEVSAALAIVGVVAVLAIPQVVKTVNKNHTGALLGRAVSQIELGCQNVVQRANDNLSAAGSAAFYQGPKDLNFRDLGFDRDDFLLEVQPEEFLDIMVPYWGLALEEVSPDEMPDIKNFDGTNGDAEHRTRIISENSSSRRDFAKIQSSVAAFSDNEHNWTIYIDTNGWRNTPNVFGRDIYAFQLLGDSCTLRPFGESDVGDDIGLHYTKQIVENGFKVNHY